MTDPLSNSLPQKHTEAVKSGHSAQMEGIKKKRQLSLPLFPGFGRGGGIRTRDPLHPMQVRYQAALRPVRIGIICSLSKKGKTEPIKSRLFGILLPLVPNWP